MAAAEMRALGTGQFRIKNVSKTPDVEAIVAAGVECYGKVDGLRN